MVTKIGSDGYGALASNDMALEKMTIDEVVDKIYNGLNVKLFVLFWTAVGCLYVTAGETYLTVFTGHIPYRDWICVSEKCKVLLARTNMSEEFYTEKTMCGNSLVAGTDFNWTNKRTSFSVDWGIYCGTEFKHSLASSLFFIGALLGLLSSTAIFDKLGRKNGAMIGSLIAAMATLAGVWTPNYELLFVIRIFQGYGQYMGFTGVYCWVLEFTPSHLRCNINSLTLWAWNFGNFLMVFLAYFIVKWQYIFLANAVINFLVTLPLFFFPISPRFALVQGRDEEAKVILEKFSKVCDNEISMESVDLVYKDRVQNYWRQLKDFKTHPSMLKRALLSCVAWFFVGALVYGYSFGWEKIGKNIYTAYIFYALGNTISFAINPPICNLIGRKKTILLFLGVGVLSNLLGMPDVKLSPDSSWTLYHVAFLIGGAAIICDLILLYLYTSELAPTSHRGMILSLSNGSARIGAFLGPFLSILCQATDTKVSMGVFGGVTVLCAVVVLFLPDTTGAAISEVPSDLQEGSGYQRLDYGTKATCSSEKESGILNTSCDDTSGKQISMSG